MTLKHHNSTALLASGVFLVVGTLTAQTGAQSQGGNSAGQTGASSAQGANAAGASSSTMGNSGMSHSGMSGASAKGADMRFAKEAAIGGLAEVQLGQLATTKASSDKVKQFGQKMVDDHTKANDELKSIAAKNNMTLPTDLDAKHKAMMAKMSALSGDQFDKAYVASMVKDHDKDVALFQQEANGGSNPDLKSFATKTLPIIQDHDRMIKEIKSGMGSKGGGSNSSSSGR